MSAAKAGALPARPTWRCCRPRSKRPCRTRTDTSAHEQPSQPLALALFQRRPSAQARGNGRCGLARASKASSTTGPISSTGPTSRPVRRSKLRLWKQGSNTAFLPVGRCPAKRRRDQRIRRSAARPSRAGAGLLPIGRRAQRGCTPLRRRCSAPLARKRYGGKASGKQQRVFSAAQLSARCIKSAPVPEHRSLCRAGAQWPCAAVSGEAPWARCRSYPI